MAGDEYLGMVKWLDCNLNMDIICLQMWCHCIHSVPTLQFISHTSHATPSLPPVSGEIYVCVVNSLLCVQVQIPLTYATQRLMNNSQLPNLSVYMELKRNKYSKNVDLVLVNLSVISQAVYIYYLLMDICHPRSQLCNRQS